MQVPGYAIQRTIGKGGMATVYLATRDGSSTPIALKLLGHPGDAAFDDEATYAEAPVSATASARFLNEARTVASLRHAHIVPVTDTGTLESNLYIAMEYVEGGDLRVRAVAAMPATRALEIAMQIAAALGAAHAQGIVHRDVKPANILFRGDGTALLSDFGAARDLNGHLALTQTGTLLGTPAYMSPEQIEGKGLDGRSDLYSLGVILYEMLTATPAYSADSVVRMMEAHVQSPVPMLPVRLAPLQGLLDKLMAKSADERYADAHAFVAHAQSLLPACAAIDNGTHEAGPGDDAEAARVCIELDPRIAAGIDSIRHGILEDLAYDRLVLPSLPDVALKVREEIESPKSSGDSIARILAVDPALSAQVLRIANSALYAGRSPIGDLPRAVVRLGGNVVQQIVMLLAVSRLMDLDARPALRTHLEQLRAHSVHVAALSEAVARHTGFADRNSALLAGLIHDIGALPVLVWAEPIPGLTAHDSGLATIVRSLQAELGRQMLERWNYPQDLVDVPVEHDNLVRVPEHGTDLADIVQIANQIALALANDPNTDPNADPADPAGPVAELPAAARAGLGAPDIAVLVAEAEMVRAELTAILSG